MSLLKMNNITSLQEYKDRQRKLTTIDTLTQALTTIDAAIAMLESHMQFNHIFDTINKLKRDQKILAVRLNRLLTENPNESKQKIQS